MTVDFDIEGQRFVAFNVWYYVQIQRSQFVPSSLWGPRRGGLDYN
jgi:hypothetical protein